MIHGRRKIGAWGRNGVKITFRLVVMMRLETFLKKVQGEEYTIILVNCMRFQKS